MLGDKKGDRVCRFCGNGKPEAIFRKVAHAIPELLGNKSIETACSEVPLEHLAGYADAVRVMGPIQRSRLPGLRLDRAADGRVGWRKRGRGDPALCRALVPFEGVFNLPFLAGKSASLQ